MKKNWLNNKTVIISGASGGLGFAITKYLIEKYNCNVIGIARNEEKLLNNRETLGDKRDNFSYFLFDVSVKENWQNFAKELENKGIVPDILINNAGFMLPFMKVEDVDDNVIDEIIKTNLCSCVYSVKALMPLLKQSKTPSIINVSSAAGLSPVVGESLYCLTKFGVRGFTETLQQDYKKKIFVCGVYPGFIKTDLMNRMEISDKNNGIIDKVMMPVSKACKKIVKGIAKKKKRIVIGLDGKSMHFLYRIMPKGGPSLITSVLKSSKLEMFDKIFDYKENKKQ
jgi:short-subunit dehydrogenase